MPIVYRWQHKLTKRGPYSPDSSYTPKTSRFIEFLRGWHVYPETHPQPADRLNGVPEFPFYPDTTYRYGFPTLKEARDWFWDLEAKLVDNGFELVEINASEVIISTSKKQVAFKT